jgi:hypothetical protein
MVAFLLSSYAIYQLMARIIFVIAHFNATQQKKIVPTLPERLPISIMIGFRLNDILKLKHRIEPNKL